MGKIVPKCLVSKLQSSWSVRSAKRLQLCSYLGLSLAYVSIDVECVATGRCHDARSVALVAIVDQDERVLLMKKVKPSETIVSFLTPLTGLRDGEQLSSVLEEVKRLLGPDVVLVGQGVKNDVNWLNLREGEDYSSTVELGELFKTYIQPALPQLQLLLVESRSQHSPALRYLSLYSHLRARKG